MKGPYDPNYRATNGRCEFNSCRESPSLLMEGTFPASTAKPHRSSRVCKGCAPLLEEKWRTLKKARGLIVRDLRTMRVISQWPKLRPPAPKPPLQQRPAGVRCPKTGKLRFPDLKSALTAVEDILARRPQEHGLNAYRCWTCTDFHLGHVRTRQASEDEEYDLTLLSPGSSGSPFPALEHLQ